MIWWELTVDNPSLQLLELHESSLSGDPGDERKTMIEPPYGYLNNIVFESMLCDLLLNRLTSV